MAGSFWAVYALKLAIVALALWALYLLGRKLRQMRFFASAGRCVSIVETTILSPHAAISVLRAGRRYFLVAAGTAGIVKLAELAAADVALGGTDATGF